MSPKKRTRRKTRRPDTTHTRRTPRATTPALARTPVVIADPPDRRITALWATAALLWFLGTPLALANLLFSVMDLQQATLTTTDPTTPPPADVDAVGNALIWVLLTALVVPAASTIAALLLRRKIAAIGFATALAISALPLLWLMPPAELWNALHTHLLG